VQKIVGATFNSLLIIFVMYFILFFMLTEARSMEKSMNKWLPLRPQSIALVKKSLNNLVFSNAIGIPLVAILQGGVAFIGYWLTGVPEPFIWFIATCVAAVIPVLGSALVYVPLSILLFANGLMVQSTILFLYGFLIVGSVDNLFRFWLQNKIGDTHPLITIFGVIVGLNLFGFIGLVFGPILISLFLLLMQIYRQEFHKVDNE
jgi:predicted PurR-regulated permease PerM